MRPVSYLFHCLLSDISVCLFGINVFCIKSESLVRKLVESCEILLMKIAIILQHQINR